MGVYTGLEIYRKLGTLPCFSLSTRNIQVAKESILLNSSVSIYIYYIKPKLPLI